MLFLKFVQLIGIVSGTPRSDLMLASLICEIQTPATTQYQLLISGVTVLYDTLYVVHQNSSCIDCYHSNSLAFDEELFVAEMSNPEDIASSDEDGYLYVVDNDESQNKFFLLKLNSFGDLQHKWCVGKNSFALSISQYANIIIAFNDKNVLKKYSCDGRLLSELTVSPSPVCNGFKHAVEIEEDRLLVCYREEARKYGLCLVDMNLGRIVERYSDDEDTASPLRSPVSLASPMYLAVGADRNIFVVDKFCRLVLMFSSDMKDAKIILSRSSHVRHPDKLCLDSANGRLFLIDDLYDDQDDSYCDSRLLVFDVGRTVNLFLQQGNAIE